MSGQLPLDADADKVQTLAPRDASDVNTSKHLQIVLRVNYGAWRR